MTWSIQLSPWGLPPLLAILLALNDGLFLWPRRREAGTPVLLALVGTVGVWGLLDFLAVASAAMAPKVAMTRIAYAPAVAAPRPLFDDRLEGRPEDTDHTPFAVDSDGSLLAVAAPDRPPVRDVRIALDWTRALGFDR